VPDRLPSERAVGCEVEDGPMAAALNAIVPVEYV
jgi:hypothetical protein